MAGTPGGTSPWFNAILNQYRDSWRNNCRTIGRLGGGTGGSALSLILNLTATGSMPGPAVDQALSEIMSLPQVVAVHLGVTDPSVEPNRPTLGATDSPVGVLIVEGYNRVKLAQAAAKIGEVLERLSISEGAPRSGLYQLAYELRPAQLADVVPYGNRPKRW